MDFIRSFPEHPKPKSCQNKRVFQANPANHLQTNTNPNQKHPKHWWHHTSLSSFSATLILIHTPNSENTSYPQHWFTLEKWIYRQKVRIRFVLCGLCLLMFCSLRKIVKTFIIKLHMCGDMGNYFSFWILIVSKRDRFLADPPWTKFKKLRIMLRLYITSGPLIKFRGLRYNLCQK